MELNLNDDQAVLLRAILNTALREQRSEIADTDSPRYKSGLRAEAETIRSMLDQLGGPLPNTI